MNLNLASHPFINRRPLKRVGIFLWSLVGILALLNGVFYLDYFRGSGRQARERFLELEDQIRAERGRIESLEMEVGRFDPSSQAEHVVFLNQRIAERTFGWGQLFDRLVDVLPLRVRLSNLSPRRQEGGSRNQAMKDKVSLAIRGLAESDNDLYELVDRLWAHPAFQDPKILNEHLQDGSIVFQLTMVYDPFAPDLEPTQPEDEGSGDETNVEAVEAVEAEEGEGLESEGRAS